MSPALLLLTFTVGILSVALAVVLVLALLPYLHIIGIVLLGLLAITALGALAYGVYLLVLHLEARHLDQELRRIQVQAARRELDYVRPTQHGHVTAIRSEDGGYRYTPLLLEAQMSRKALPGPAESTPTEPEIVIPHAPAFRDMCHLLTAGRLVLCYTAQGPAYGTVEDLLSMAIVGKPGRGKTTALLYYVAILLGVGAEVHVWDPHGSMRELADCHPHLSYLDTLDELPRSIALLTQVLDERSLLFKQRRQVRHPLLLLVDELPVIGDYEKLLKKRGVSEEQTPTHLIKRLVLEARKWRCFFIASGQSTDAEILPTRVTENLSSRIVFFSSDRRARMAGLEHEAVKKFLPVIRRAGSGVMVFDCSSWDEPVLGAIPETTVEDLHDFFFGGPHLLRTPEQRASIHQEPTIPSTGNPPSTGHLADAGNSRKASPPLVERFPTFPTGEEELTTLIPDVADAGTLPDMSGRRGSAPGAVGKSLGGGSHLPGNTPGTPSQVARKVPQTKAISRDLYYRIKAEYDRGTPKSEVCGKLRIGNDYYPTIRAIYQQFDLERQRTPGKTSVLPPESEES